MPWTRAVLLAGAAMALINAVMVRPIDTRLHGAGALLTGGGKRSGSRSNLPPHFAAFWLACAQAGRFDLTHRGRDHLHKLVDALETSHHAVRHGKPASEVDIPLHVIRGVRKRVRCRRSLMPHSDVSA